MQLILDKVNYIYGSGTSLEQHAIKDINLTIHEGEFIGLIGHTGSGKSTLIQHMNGLIKATSGKVYFEGEDIYEPDYNLTQLRSKVGLVFQYPEHQLFETTVFNDVMFGPKNLGLSKIDAGLRAHRGSGDGWYRGRVLMCHLLNYQVDKNEELQLQVSLQCSLKSYLR